MLKMRFKNKLIDKVYVSLGVVLLIGLTLFSIVSTSNIKQLEDGRLKVLDGKESLKLRIVEDIRLYLKVKDEKSYALAKSDCQFTKELKDKLFGSRYNGAKYFYADEVSFIDAQYSLEDDKYLIIANAKKGGKNYILNIVVSVNNNLIYDISLI